MTAYQLTLTGTGGPLVLPLDRIYCTRRAGESSWVTVAVPIGSAALETTLRAATDWVINIDADGGAFLQATLTAMIPDHSPHLWKWQFTGRIINPGFTAQTRSLVDVTEIGDENGRHFARASVLPLLRPNDTVDDGVQSWVAGAIVYEISTQESWMQVTEVAA